MSSNDLSINMGKGIINLGNTCYLNTVLQMLSAFPEFQPSHPKSPLYKKREKHPLFIKWNEIVETLLSADKPEENNQVIHPGLFIQTLVQYAKSKTFHPNQREPQDAAEFLQFLVEEFHQILAHPVKADVQGTSENVKDDLAKACYEMLAEIYRTSYSEIYPLCYGITVSTLTPLSTVSNSPFIHPDKKDPSKLKPLSIKPETFFFLNVPLPPCPPFQLNAPVTLYQCIDHMIAPEIMDNENAWYDEKLGYKRPVNKQTLFWSFPPILAITLQRLLPDGNKDNRVVQFPLKYLKLTPYVCGYNKDQYVYELMAICYHHGDLGGGHYTAMVKKTDSQWVHYNDHMVQPLPAFPPDTPETVIQQELEKVLQMPSAYCLLYRKIFA
jgi:ubiquitin C-terminal hydrolase